MSLSPHSVGKFDTLTSTPAASCAALASALLRFPTTILTWIHQMRRTSNACALSCRLGPSCIRKALHHTWRLIHLSLWHHSLQHLHYQRITHRHAAQDLAVP